MSNILEDAHITEGTLSGSMVPMMGEDSDGGDGGNDRDPLGAQLSGSKAKQCHPDPCLAAWISWGLSSPFLLHAVVTALLHRAAATPFQGSSPAATVF